MFQRTASLISSMQHLYTQTDKHLCAYCSTGAWPRGGDGAWEVASGGQASDGQREHCRSSSFEEVAYAKFQLRGEPRSVPSAISPEWCGSGWGCSGRSLDRYEKRVTVKEESEKGKARV